MSACSNKQILKYININETKKIEIYCDMELEKNWIKEEPQIFAVSRYIYLYYDD